MRGKSVRRCGFRVSLCLAGRGLAAKANSIWASCSISRCHDVSMLIGLDGRAVGVEPGSKISMTIMRPPQHGHGSKDVSGSSARAPALPGSVVGAPAIGEQAVVADGGGAGGRAGGEG